MPLGFAVVAFAVTTVNARGVVHWIVVILAVTAVPDRAPVVD